MDSLADAPVEKQFYTLLRLCRVKAIAHGLKPLYIECRYFEMEQFVPVVNEERLGFDLRRVPVTHIDGTPTRFVGDSVTVGGQRLMTPRVICKDYFVLRPYWGMQTSVDWVENDLRINYNGGLRFEITQELL